MAGEAGRAFRAVLVANIFSALAGLFLLPVSTGLIAAVSEAMTMGARRQVFEFVNLLCYAPIAIAFSTLIEWGALARYFGVPRSGLSTIFYANVASTFIATFRR